MWLLFLMVFVICLAATYWYYKDYLSEQQQPSSLRFEDWQLTSSPHLRFFLILINSKRTPSRQWSCATTSPCSASIKRPSSSSSTFQSHPTFWGLLLTPRSKDTERWGRMCENGFKKKKKKILSVLCWLKELMRIEPITGRIIRDSASSQKVSHMPLPYSWNIYSRIQHF